jgi:hypothetical protein
MILSTAALEDNRLYTAIREPLTQARVEGTDGYRPSV